MTPEVEKTTPGGPPAALEHPPLGGLRQGECKKILGGIEFCVHEANTAVLLSLRGTK